MKDYGLYAREDIIEMLKRLDLKIAKKYTSQNERIKICIAGSVCAIFYINDYRRTNDIDIIDSNYNIDEDILNEFSMNTAVQNISDCNIPYSYMDRIQKIEIDTRIIDYYLISLEDFVIMKLMSYRPQDKFDINRESITSKLDWNQLDKLAQEMNEVFMNDRLKTEFYYVYNEYKDRWKK